jgi:hypothetical protein
VTAIAARFVGGIRWTHPKTIGVFGIFLGAFAFWLALPPLAARTEALPILFGVLAIAAGIWSWSRDQRRVGGGAIAAGALGIAFGVLATQSSTAHLDSVVVWSALGAATLRYATPLTYAAIGGLFCERSGVVNIALEGMLLTGAFFGIWGAIWAHGWAGNLAWIVGLAVAMLAGMAAAAIHAVWSISLKVDQIISRSGSPGSCSSTSTATPARRGTSPTTASPTSTSTSCATGTSSGRSSASST